LEPGLKLAITLRYLATQNSYKSLQYGLRIAHSTICMLTVEICKAIMKEYSAKVTKCPVTLQEWKAVAESFSTKRNFPHCIGTTDGKCAVTRCPKNEGSLYFNYKGFHSIDLLALVHADYKVFRRWANDAQVTASPDQLLTPGY